MGNAESQVASGIKAQVDSGQRKLYRLISLKGDGELVTLMKVANRTKDYSILDEKIRTEVRPFLYNGGAGKWIPKGDIVKIRHADREDEFQNVAGTYKSLKPVDHVQFGCIENGNAQFGSQNCPYRFCCWDLDQRGTVGETILHLCFLNASSLHADLAKRLLMAYPNMIRDIYVGDVYYGESVLHMAIVNEDPAIVKFLLDRGAEVNDRTCGSFFTADDQKDHRKDTYDQENPDIPIQTNYDGYSYWGEYPLGFAACLGQEECVRLLLAKGADPNKQDGNGNTVLHMLVILDKKEMFDVLHSQGARLHIRNRKGLTPLTLAAHLARKEMYEHILELSREIQWVFGNVICAAYPLSDIDSISQDGSISEYSAIYKIVHGDALSHVEMLDGVVAQILRLKWNTFIKSHFYWQFGLFTLYFLIFMLAFVMRPGRDLNPIIRQMNLTTSNNSHYSVNKTINDPCYLMKNTRTEDSARFVLELMTIIGATCYLYFAAYEIHQQKLKIFFQTLSAAPMKALFLFSCILVLLMVPGRAACMPMYEDVMGIMAILCTAPYFLFFCRGFKMVGPFVVMIYKMVRGDLLRFVIIYAVFMIGFSQAMFVVFRRVDADQTIFSNAIEAMVGMFIMSLGEFGDIYEQLEESNHARLGKVIFVAHMVLVTLLLVNMLIAMMGNTYQMVTETQGEWLRQWASILLVVEQGVSANKRKLMQEIYSQPLSDGQQRAVVIRWHQTREVEEKDLETAKQEKQKLLRSLMIKNTQSIITDTDSIENC
ncbi:transient receptor potential cation channel subfamily V member 5-like [Tubulanus polymorphus]|uniref:transient receptor potential cation channel subfamily V member 5-like n=1 Tax=Tubulanus polymorphus TaxID=672921 RepID=UPI003DA69B2E